jgi:hypothetical protein
MRSFLAFLREDFLVERDTSAAAAASANNNALGAAYETATALRLHSMTGSSKNKDAAHKKRIERMQTLHDASMTSLSPEKQKQVLEYANNSATAYLDSLKKNKGIKPEDIHEVHHTYAGIDDLMGKKVDRAGNPHDIAIKTKDGTLHGASLKFKPGTLSNSTTNTFDQASNAAGIKTDITGIWNAAKKKAGLEGLSGKEIKARREDPQVLAANKAAQLAAAKHHSEAFNSAKPAQKKAMLQSLMKTSPDLDYDYVVGSKKTSEPIMEKKHTQVVNNAKDFKATHTPGGVVHIHDQDGNHVMSYEHRPTHGAFSSIQVNGKLGNLGGKKPAAPAAKPIAKPPTTKQTIKKVIGGRARNPSAPKPVKSAAAAAVQTAAQPARAAQMAPPPKPAPAPTPTPSTGNYLQAPPPRMKIQNHINTIKKTN